MAKRDVCRSCRWPVVFVPSAKTGRPMILDAAPSKGVVLVGHPIGVDNAFDVVGADDTLARVVDVYTDHHATCPNAAAWKGKSRANPPAGDEGGANAAEEAE